MTIVIRRPLLVICLIGGSWWIYAQTPSACTTSKLTDDDARILLYVTPAAVAARESGTDVDIEQSRPSKEFPATDYFVAALVSRKPTGESNLGNGILGYFAVDKRTAVVESLGDFTPIKGRELMRVQSWLRNGHCIHAKVRADAK